MRTVEDLEIEIPGERLTWPEPVSAFWMWGGRRWRFHPEGHLPSMIAFDLIMVVYPDGHVERYEDVQAIQFEGRIRYEAGEKGGILSRCKA